jgi:hypothetical protein
LLLDVAALLITSAALGNAAEASVVPQNIAIVSPSTSSAPPLLAASNAPHNTPGYGTLIDPSAVNSSVSISYFEVAPVDTSALKALTGTPLLRQLSLLSGNQLSAFVSGNPKLVTALLAAPPSSAEVSTWWTSLDAAEQATLVESAPRLTGNLNGIPTALRNTANRAWVKQSIGALNDKIASSSGRAIIEDAQHQSHMLSEISDALGTSKSVPQRSLLSVDPTGQGRAAIVLGNVATADYVTYMIPGMFFTVDGQLDDWTDAASRLYDEQVSWLNLIDKPAAGERQKTVAVVAWMGYQTPDLTNIGSLDLAYTGRDAIAGVIEGLQAERTGNEPYITVLAHSYGSTAALMALTEYDFEIDALAVVGSPGSAAQSVSDLHVRDGNVYVGEAAWDPVPNSAWFGSDPGSPSYGAKKMAVGGGIDQITKDVLAPSFGHNEYFGAGTESMRNMALIGIGHGELVTDGTDKDKTRTLALEH